MQDLSNLINALDGPFALADETGCIVASNASFAAHCLHATTSLVGTQIQDVWEPTDKDALNAYLARLATFKPDKPPKPFTGTSMNAKAFHTGEGWSIICQGTSPRSEDPLLHFFLEHVDQGFWDLDSQTGRYVVSDAWRRMRGIDLDDDINDLGRDWLDDVHPDDRESLTTLLEGQLRGETQSFQIQYRRLHLKTNAWIWLLCRATVIAADANGRPLRIVGTDTDITEIKNNETRLAQLNTKIEMAIDVSGIGMFEFDLNTSRLFWDDRLLSIYGLPPGENERSSDDWGTYIHPDDADDTLAYAEECAITHSDLKRDFRIMRPDGQVRHLRTMARYINLSETETKLTGVNIDVTDDVLRTQELEKARAQLEFDSRHDALTGLANRRLMDETVASVLAGPENLDGEDMCVMHIDLDFFKEINDAMGHAAGDAVLVHVANTLTRILEDARLISRFGGDEFAVLFAPAPPSEAIKALAEDVVAAFQHPYIFEGQACAFSVSIGSATGRDKETVFSQADIALYAAKNAGRARYREYSSRAGARAYGRLRRRQDLVDAIADEKIECWYQPQFDAVSHKLVGAEALARLRLGEDDLRSPDDFLPLAEENGLLNEIEEFIFQCVLADQSEWANAGLYYPGISVNLSRHRLAEKTLVERMAQQIEPHHMLSFEVLETAFLDDPDTPLHHKIEDLRSLGIEIELDDFGSGHASVVSMLTVRPDKIKIDQRLTRDIATSPQAMTILKALVSIGRSQGIGIVLEGIETPEQLKAAQSVDCDALQGFALSPPLTATDFGVLLEDRVRHRVGEP